MKRPRLSLNLTGLIVIIAVGVLLPVMLSTAAGIVAIAIAERAGTIVTGVLVISFAVTAAGSALIAVVLAGRKARLARLQSDFVANISHEFRTPLSAIRLYAQTLQSGKLADDPERTAQCVATILRETEWLDVMIDGVLTWRASSGDLLELNMVTQPVSQAVNDAIERFRSMVPPEEISLSCAANSAVPVQHDVRALTGVVLNLLTNAYKYAGDRKTIAVTVRDETNRAIIEVADDGIGLTDNEARQVFRPFYRADTRGAARSAGAGLGLAIARHVVNRHKGQIGVTSEKGRGSTFTISLPAASGAS